MGDWGNCCCRSDCSVALSGGARTRRGWVVLFVELEGVLVKWLEQFQKIDFLCGC